MTAHGSLRAQGVEPSSQATAERAGDPNAQRVPAKRERKSLARQLGFATTIALLVTGALTFLILFGLTPLEPNQGIVRTALLANTLLALVLVALITLEVLKLLRYRRKGRAAARLHIRIVGLFALVAAIPAILVAIIASITLDLGLDRWFEMRTKEIVDGSVSVAQAYVDESARVHVNATISMAAELDRARRLYSLDRRGFTDMMVDQMRGRGMVGAQLLRIDGKEEITTKIAEEVVVPPVPADSLAAANEGDVIFIPRGDGNLVGAVLKFRVIPDMFLYTVRPLREDVLQSLRQMEANVTEYSEMEQNRLPVQLTFAVLYLGVSLMVLLASIWMGLSVADRFVRPLRQLITAADAVSDGNFDVQVDTKHTEGDFKNLSDTFNEMTTELKRQRSELLEANEDIDKRARFTEAVLSGVTAAVIGVDQDGKVRIANSTTHNLLGEEVPAGKRIGDLFPALGTALENARHSGKSEYREQVTMPVEGQSRTLNVTVTQEREQSAEHSFVITIDDITELVAAQRSAAWSDVARRIAHEIKNPLTPIQLSAERLRKRYGKYISEDREVFDQCTDTIVRHVGDIGRMVDEFSSFARMPKPQMANGNINKTVQEALFTQKVANPEIGFSLDLGQGPNTARFDERLLSQALINVIKNAVEAIEGINQEREVPVKGEVQISVRREGAAIVIDVTDNGKGLPKEDRHKLLEPYMTTRQKGTGLGLAIVRKILEDHGGSIDLHDAPAVQNGGSGAMMRLRLPALESVEGEEATDLSVGERKTDTEISKAVSDSRQEEKTA